MSMREMSMRFVLTGKAGEVFERLAELQSLVERGGGILYDGRRRSGTGEIVVMKTEVDILGYFYIVELLPEASQEVYNHSPGGFEWGYGGSGPAQLALALLLDATGDEAVAVRYHQEFKEAFVAGWTIRWRIDAGIIRRWAELKQNYERLGDG